MTLAALVKRAVDAYVVCPASAPVAYDAVLVPETAVSAGEPVAGAVFALPESPLVASAPSVPRRLAVRFDSSCRNADYHWRDRAEGRPCRFCGGVR